MSDDLENAMLTAMLSDVMIVDEINVDDQVRFLTKNIDNVPLEARILIARLVKNSGFEKSLMKCEEGLVINLNPLVEKNPEIIKKMYEMLTIKMQNRNITY